MTKVEGAAVMLLSELRTNYLESRIEWRSSTSQRIRSRRSPVPGTYRVPEHIFKGVC